MTDDRSLDSLRAAFDAALDALLIFDAAGRLTDANAAAAQLFGVTRDDLLLTSRGALPLRADDATRGATGVVTRPDGTLRQVEVRERSGAGDACGLLVLHDVTDHRRALAALRQSESWLERAQSVAHIGSWVSSPCLDGALRWSPETYRIFGVTPDEFDGSVDAFYRCVHPDDVERVREAALAALRDEAPYRIEHRVVHRDGAVRWVYEEAEILRDTNAVAVEMIGTCQDVTERRHLEEELAQAHKMEAVGRLAGGVAHDFNNLLTVVLGYSELIAAEGALSEAQRARVDAIRRAGERASALTRQLLAFSRRQILKPRVLDVRRTLRELEPILRQLIGEHIHLEISLPADALRVRADPTQLDQVVLNLVVNARDAMPAGGRLSVVVSVEDGDVDGDSTDGTVGGSAPDANLLASHVRLRVVDTGAGMSRDILQRLFEPFFTTKAERGGTGLGLATAYGIVRQSGGVIRVASEVGAGSRFDVCLPLVLDEDDVPVVTAPARTPRGGGETVLLAEDEPAIRALAEESLRSHGYSVLAAESGTAALAVAARHPAAIHLLVSDVVMPGLSGPELLRRLRVSRPALPVLFMSGYADHATHPDGAHGSLAPDTPLLSKPFAPSALVERVREVIQRCQERSAKHR